MKEGGMVNVAYMVRECVNKYQVTEPILVEERISRVRVSGHEDIMWQQ